PGDASRCSIRCTRPLLFHDPPPPAPPTLSLHDALPIYEVPGEIVRASAEGIDVATGEGILRLLEVQLPGKKPITAAQLVSSRNRSEEHTSELQSRENLVCRLLLEKKKELARQPRNREAT